MKIFVTYILTGLLVYSVSADVLVLNSGKKYTGKITSDEPGTFTIQTKLGKLQFKEEVVSLKQTKFTPPDNAREVKELLEDKSDYAAALPLVQGWIEEYKNLPTEWYERGLYFTGLCQAMTGKEAEAEKNFNTLLEVFPDTSYKNDVRSRLIDMQVSGAEGAELKEKLEDLLADKGTPYRTRALTHKNLGKYYEKEGNAKKALEHYATVVVLYGDVDEGDLQETAQARLADLFLSVGRTNEARFYYKQIIEVYPDGQFTDAARKQLSNLTTPTGE